MFKPAHKHSIRAVSLTRRIRQEQGSIMALKGWQDDIEVVLPKGYDGSENVGYREVLNDEVSGACLKVAGRRMSKDRVRAMLAETSEATVEHRQVIRDCQRKLNVLGIKG